MTNHTMQPEYAIAIRPVGSTYVAPVVYDLIGISTNIGSAEANDIVLTGSGVEPYHLAIRQMSGRLVLMVDWSLARREGLAWREHRPDDSLFCEQHGTLPPDAGRCPHCGKDSATIWLIRTLESGDEFAIGEAFEATILSQEHADESLDDERRSASHWPDLARINASPVQIAADTDEVRDQPYPLEDSNLWVWSPPESPIPVFIHQRANQFVTRHAYANSDREIGGVLLGDVYRNPENGVVYPILTHAIPARFATEARGHLTFTHDTWRDLNRRRENSYPDKQVVGWYHTHPGLDIFLSQMDLFIHHNFFRQAWQVALVIDPYQDRAGFFVWAGSELLDPQQPHQLFRVADMEDSGEVRRSRIRIKLGERIT